MGVSWAAWLSALVGIAAAFAVGFAGLGGTDPTPAVEVEDRREPAPAARPALAFEGRLTAAGAGAALGDAWQPFHASGAYAMTLTWTGQAPAGLVVSLMDRDGRDWRVHAPASPFAFRIPDAGAYLDVWVLPPDRGAALDVTWALAGAPITEASA